MTEKRRRTLLLGAIVLVLAATAYVKLQLAERERGGGVESPAARAQAALDLAREAAVSDDLEGVERALATADDAITEALALGVGERVDMLHARVTVASRRARVAERRGRAGEAIRALRDADAQAAQLLERAPVDERARQARLAVALDLAESLHETGGSEAARALESGLSAVEETLARTPPGDAVRRALASGWIRLAELRETASAVEACRRAVEHTAATTAGDPGEAAARRHAVLARAVQVADAAGDEEAARGFEEAAIETVRLRLTLGATEEATLAKHLRRLADRVGGPQGLTLTDEAVGLWRAALARGDAGAALGLARALNDYGALLSKAGRDEDALARYAEAVEATARLEGAERRTRLVALGNHAQLLGRLDRMVEAKRVAADAWALAVSLADAPGSPGRAQVDAALAGLRHARLLRAAPRPDARAARTIAAQARERLSAAGEEGARAASVSRGLDALSRELR